MFSGSVSHHVTVDERLGEFVGDERKIKQILLNLLSNAVKFTPEGGRIGINARQVDGSVEISVSDTGIGIAPEDQPKIFEEFRQVGSDYSHKLRERDWVNLGQEMCRATGTVDKFQGQQAPIVFFSIATSSDQDPPRNLAFLFSRNCLNMAISRAQCLAYLVCSPRLLEARCPSIEEMELVNALCRFAHQRVKTAAGLCQ